MLELGRNTEVPTPNNESVYAAASLLGHTLAQQRGRLVVQPA